MIVQTNEACDDGNTLDGDGCTPTCKTDRCYNVTCPQAGPCYEPRVCNPATGACSNTPKPNGAACTDNNGCTRTDTCQNGTCVGGDPVICEGATQCHGAGTCNTTTGQCSYTNQPDGTVCNDGNSCTTAEQCQSGQCAGVPTVVDDLNPCTADFCDPVTGVGHSDVGAGTSCTDFNPCNGAEICDGSGHLLNVNYIDSATSITSPHQPPG